MVKQAKRWKKAQKRLKRALRKAHREVERKVDRFPEVETPEAALALLDKAERLEAKAFRKRRKQLKRLAKAEAKAYAAYALID